MNPSLTAELVLGSFVGFYWFALSSGAVLGSAHPDGVQLGFYDPLVSDFPGQAYGLFIGKSSPF